MSKIELKFKEGIEAQGTSDFWYDCTMGGYIKPENFLEPESAEIVKKAIEIVRLFEEMAEEEDIIYSL